MGAPVLSRNVGQVANLPHNFMRPLFLPTNIGWRSLIRLWRLSKPIAKRSATGFADEVGLQLRYSRWRSPGRGRCCATAPEFLAERASDPIPGGRHGPLPSPPARWRGGFHKSLRDSPGTIA